jgi:glutamate decarboxylase
MNSDPDREKVSEEILRLFSMSSPSIQEYRSLAWSYLRSFLSRPEVVVQSATHPRQNSPFDGGEVSFSAYYEYVLDTVIPNSTNMASPRCMGHMTSVAPGFVWPLAELVIALNQNLVKNDASRLLTPLERQALAMLHELVYNRPKSFYEEHAHNIGSTLGIMTTGGTLSNICALWVARNKCLGPSSSFGGIEKEGLPAAIAHSGYARVVVLASRFAHYSIQKAVGVLGLGERNLISIPVDKSGRMKVGHLRKQVDECRERNWNVLAIVATAGTTDCGSIDDLAEIGSIAREMGTHFHVDAAWGLPLLFSRQYRHRLAGIDQADTVTADGHKQLYLPLGNSMLLLRDPGAASVIEKQSRYMLQSGSGDLGQWSLEGSRSGSGLLLHAALHVIGAEGYAYLVEENIRKARLMASKIEQMPEFALLLRPETNILLYRYIPRRFRWLAQQGALTSEENACINELNERLQSIQREEGRTFVSRTTIDCAGADGRLVLALRAIILNPLITEADIEYLLQDQLEIAAHLELATERGAVSATNREPLAS